MPCWPAPPPLDADDEPKHPFELDPAQPTSTKPHVERSIGSHRVAAIEVSPLLALGNAHTAAAQWPMVNDKPYTHIVGADRLTKEDSILDNKSLPADKSPKFMYLVAKAKRYLELGPEAYRSADFFDMPSADWSAPVLAAIESGMEQICRFKGYSSDSPLEHIGVEGFYPLLATLHFELEHQAAHFLDERTILDEMHMKHWMDGSRVVLYNKVLTE